MHEKIVSGEKFPAEKLKNFVDFSIGENCYDGMGKEEVIQLSVYI